jgi:cell wall-associated NlpC family hydrolase
LPERAPARHRADLPPSTPFTGITSSISAVVGDHAATIGRGGVVVAVSSGLVTGMGLPAAAATNVDTAQTASVPVLGGTTASSAVAGVDLLASAPVTAPTKARVSFEHSAFTATAKGSASAATPASATREVATISRSLARAAYRAASPAPALDKPANKPVARPVTSARRTSTGNGTGTDDGAGTRTRVTAGDGTGTTKPAPPETSRVDDQAPDVVSIALRYLGIAYRYGGTTPRGFDCSGFTQYVFRQIGVALPRTADQQLRAATRISRSAARAGDLVFFLSGGYAYHVGIYLGNGKMVDSPRRGTTVTVRSVYSSNVAFARA